MSRTEVETHYRILRRFRDPDRDDRAGISLTRAVREAGGPAAGRLRSARLLCLALDLSPADVEEFAREVFCDPLLHEWVIWRVETGAEGRARGERPPVSSRRDPEGFSSCVLVSFLPGMTDDEGANAERLLRAMHPSLGQGSPDAGPSVQRVFSQAVWWLERGLGEAELRALWVGHLGNPLINHFEAGRSVADFTYLPFCRGEEGPQRPRFSVVNLATDPASLQELSRTRVWALSEAEMLAVKAYHERPETAARRRDLGMPDGPTDCEMEIIAQTWSEHCMHKEFAAIVDFRDLDTGERSTIDSLFATFIREPTLAVQERLRRNGFHWLVKVFADNAGLVRIDPGRLFAWKVETHNSPCALDPYGGALTGIVGVNRDPLGTGRGGARLLFNTNVLCFGFPDDRRPLLPGQLHPLRVLRGVAKGIEDGGNKSGVPTINGAIVFHDGFRGKPLVFCGTAAVLPESEGGEPAWEKRIRPGDRIIMAGGRVGRDGIHGATFSSIELGPASPRSAVQIGSPFTQKMLADFLREAAGRGLYHGITDNGAGGLSSSVGELARISGGARVDLDHVPLKYPGLQGWEIFVSESQERMTLVTRPQSLDELLALGRQYEVELSDIGEFSDTGLLEVQWGGERIACLPLDFLHDGAPRKRLEAEWKRPQPQFFKPPPDSEIPALWRRLMALPDIASKGIVIHQYDHEVKGRTILKPLMGEKARQPQDAGVMRLDFDGWTGVAVSNGLCPRYALRDPYQASLCAFDEAVRQIVAVGGRTPDPERGGDSFWSLNDNFCVPDSVWDPSANPDGREKLGRLVMMCRALRDAVLAFGIPMTSGKDSMKNDFRAAATKISVPPTVLYSAATRIDDVRTVVSSEFKEAGDAVLLVGQTREELGESQLARVLGSEGGVVPSVRLPDAVALYRRMGAAHDRRLLCSAHDLSDGGLAACLAECCFGTGLGARLVLPGVPMSLAAWLFSESPSRFVVSVKPSDVPAFEALMGGNAARIGEVSREPRITIRRDDGTPIVDLGVAELEEAWMRGLEVIG